MFERFRQVVASKSREEKGASAVEYALIAGLIAVAIMTAVGTLGGDVSDTFTNISDKLTQS
jgi:pilus assembly protein Flp/PilA